MINKEPRNVVRVRKHLRVRKTISGTALKPRLCVFRSNAHIEAQIIDDVKGVTLCQASSLALGLKNGGNIEAAKAVGTDLATKAMKLKIVEVVFDRGGYIYHGRVAALADAARAAGLKF